MRNQSKYLLLIALILAIYYVILAIYLNGLGYFSQEGLFYVEKSKIIIDGYGDRLKVMGLTSPILPFYTSFIFSKIDILAPIIASALCTALLFYMMAISL